MPRFESPSGAIVYVPGVYSVIKVVSDLPGPLPEFQIPIIVGEADEADYPYTFSSVKQAIEDDHIPFLSCGTSSAVRASFGPDSNLAVAMAFAKRHGLPWAYIVAVNALTRASVIATSTGPISQGTIFAKRFGAVGGHIKLKVASGTTVTVTPVKRYSLLTADALTGKSRLYVKDNSWIAAGDTIYVGDNNTADAAYVVDSIGTELTATGQVSYYVQLTTTLAADITAAQYGMVLIWDEDNAEEPDAFANLQAMLDWFNDESVYLGMVKGGGWTNPAALVALGTATPIKEIAAWSTATPGTSPAATSSDHTTFLSNLDATDWDRFCLDQQVIPHSFLVLDSSATIHGLWRDFAIAKRAEGSSIAVFTGCAWGDTDLNASGDTDPTERATALNCQDVAIWAGGLDRIASYLSMAPAVFGRFIAGGVGHNLTNDELLFSSLEKTWDERNSGELTKLHKKGVGTYRLSTAGGVIRYVISQGISTLQNNASSWNESDASTPLLMQRILADFADRVIKQDLDASQLGGDEITQASVSAVVVKRCDKSLLKRGRITSYRINSIALASNGAGWDVDVGVGLPVTADFIGLRTNILIG